jgi:hypothetical protein
MEARDIPWMGPPRHRVFKPSSTCISADDPLPSPPSTSATTRPPDESEPSGVGDRVALAGTKRHRPALDVTGRHPIVIVAPSPGRSGCSGGSVASVASGCLRLLRSAGRFGGFLASAALVAPAAEVGSVASVGLGQPTFTVMIAPSTPAVAATPDRDHPDEASPAITRHYQALPGITRRHEAAWGVRERAVRLGVDG